MTTNYSINPIFLNYNENLVGFISRLKKFDSTISWLPYYKHIVYSDAETVEFFMQVLFPIAAVVTIGGSMTDNLV